MAEENKNDNAAAPASLVERLVIWIDAEKEKQKAISQNGGIIMLVTTKEMFKKVDDD